MMVTTVSTTNPLPPQERMATIVGQGVPAEFRQAVTEFRPPIAHEGKPLHWIDAGAGPQPVMWRMGMWWVIGQGRPVSLHQAAEWAWRYLAPVEWKPIGVDQSVAELEARLQLLTRIDAVVPVGDEVQQDLKRGTMTCTVEKWRRLQQAASELEAENARLRSFAVGMPRRTGASAHPFYSAKEVMVWRDDAANWRFTDDPGASIELTEENIRKLEQATQHVPSQAAYKAEKTGEKSGKAAPLPANALRHGWAKR